MYLIFLAAMSLRSLTISSAVITITLVNFLIYFYAYNTIK